MRTPMNALLRWGLAALGSLIILMLATPTFAHHPFGGMTPENWVQGFLSGMGHPVIGPDHLVFTIIVGLLATQLPPYWAVPAAFLTAALAGTGLHLMELNLPTPEFLISFSVLLFGGLAVGGRYLKTVFVIAMAAVAGLFHGYAYGEAIVGAEITPLLSYLIGFTMIQGGIIAGSFLIFQKLLDPDRHLEWLRYAGLVVLGIGAAFLSSVVLG
ncbi:MAG: HupE/UreJ family protein [Leptolyngbya sp. SIO1D8]|nr:HupE/UreJ family protein [Leptolyngbya sp. SIO1D8]